MEDYSDDIKEAVAVMRKGGIILYPTDTVWGIGCDASCAAAVRRIFALKRRADSKSMIALVDSPDMLWRTVDNVPEVAGQLVEVAVRPTTIIYDHGRNVAPELLAGDGSLGVRVTEEAFSKQLCRRMGRAVVSTSANISGEKTPLCFDDISPEIKNGVDYVCRSRRMERGNVQPSMVIKISDNGVFRVIRE